MFKNLRLIFNKSDKIEINDKRTFVLKGFYFYFLNDIKQSNDYFENVKQ